MRNSVTKKRSVISLFFLLIVGLSNNAWAENKEGKIMNNEQAKVSSVVESMTAAFHQKDMAGVLASYESGGTVIFEPDKPISDPELLKEMFGEYFQVNPKFTYPNGHEVYIANDIALHIAPWVMTATAPDGTGMSERGLSVAVLRKQKSGEWLMVIDNPNGQALMESK